MNECNDVKDRQTEAAGCEINGGALFRPSGSRDTEIDSMEGVDFCFTQPSITYIKLKHAGIMGRLTSEFPKSSRTKRMGGWSVERSRT